MKAKKFNSHRTGLRAEATTSTTAVKAPLENEFAFFQTRFYLASLNFLTMGNFRRSRILMDSIQVQKEKEKNHRRVFTSFLKDKTCIGKFHMVVLQWTSRKCTKKRDARAMLLFWPWKQLSFERSCCCRLRGSGCLSPSNMANMTSYVNALLGHHNYTLPVKI